VGGSCGICGRGEKSVQGLLRKSEGKLPLGRPRCTWDERIRMAVREIGAGWVQRIHVAQVRV
jgi:hypothetical protein